MSIEAVVTDKAPAAVGPYSAATKSGNCIHVSGQLPVDPATGEFAGDDIQAQTRQSLTNVKNVLEAAGATMADVAETVVLLDSIADFGAMNEVYAQFFQEPYPARSVSGSRRLRGCRSPQGCQGRDQGCRLPVMGCCPAKWSVAL